VQVNYTDIFCISSGYTVWSALGSLPRKNAPPHTPKPKPSPCLTMAATTMAMTNQTSSREALPCGDPGLVSQDCENCDQSPDYSPLSASVLSRLKRRSNYRDCPTASCAFSCWGRFEWPLVDKVRGSLPSSSQDGDWEDQANPSSSRASLV